jgi:hypothetical protein
MRSPRCFISTRELVVTFLYSFFAVDIVVDFAQKYNLFPWYLWRYEGHSNTDWGMRIGALDLLRQHFGRDGSI